MKDLAFLLPRREAVSAARERPRRSLAPPEPGRAWRGSLPRSPRGTFSDQTEPSATPLAAPGRARDHREAPRLTIPTRLERSGRSECAALAPVSISLSEPARQNSRDHLVAGRKRLHRE